MVLRIIQRQFSYFFNENIHCDLAETAVTKGQKMFLIKKYGKLSLNCSYYAFLSGALSASQEFEKLMKIIFVLTTIVV